jgi:hypothetical protein
MYIAAVICIILLIGIASVIRAASSAEEPDSSHCAMVAPCAVQADLQPPWAPDNEERPASIVNQRHLKRNQKFVDSALEGSGFELAVPRQTGCSHLVAF